MNKIVVLSVDDWEALYVNGVNVYEDHMIEVRDLAKYCPIENIKRLWVGDTILVNGRFPKNLPVE
ncbi:MAG TPA: hypothetical protein PKV52_04510 [Candidatus Saccharibacteria bacterium]|nr:hypothetical protein [Candidatus Saccharibacteria bacterium]